MVPLLTSIPTKLPVVAVACWLAERIRSPLTVVRLAPDETAMFRAVVKLMPPVPLVATAPVAVTLIWPLAYAVKLLSADRVSALVKVRLPSGAAAEPIVRPAENSGNELMLRASVALPRLIVSVPLGLANDVASNDIFVLRSRDNPLSKKPSSSRAAELPPAGRLNTMSVAVPELKTGSGAVYFLLPKLLITTDPSLPLV